MLGNSVVCFFRWGLASIDVNSSNQVAVADQDMAGPGFKKVSPMFTDVGHYAIPVPMLRHLVLNGRVGANSEGGSGHVYCMHSLWSPL